MKKQLLIAAVISLMGLTCFLMSCKKDKDETKMCTCTESDGDYSETQQINPSSFGAANCADLAIKLRMANGEEFSYSCH